jgi:hypothetical protein
LSSGPSCCFTVANWGPTIPPPINLGLNLGFANAAHDADRIAPLAGRGAQMRILT